MSRKYITPNGIKDENGSYLPLPTPPKVTTPLESPRGLSIDDLLMRGLHTCDLLMKDLTEHVTHRTYDRETVQNLKDVMAMLHDLKEKEAALIEDLTDEELSKHASDA